MVASVCSRIAGEALGVVAAADQVSERPVGRRRALEAAVEQRIGDAGLLLHAVGERDIGVGHVADIKNEIRLERRARPRDWRYCRGR